jgi:hypothetical protein
MNGAVSIKLLDKKGLKLLINLKQIMIRYYLTEKNQQQILQ